MSWDNISIEHEPLVWVRAQEITWEKEREKLLVAFTEKVIQTTLKQELDAVFKNIDALVEKTLAENHEQYKIGKSFAERKVLSDKIAYLKKWKEGLKIKKRAPFSEFLAPGDYERIKAIGFRKFIRYYYL